MKPIQVMVTHQRSENEQWGSETIYVLCDNGRIWRQDNSEAKWAEVHGPWENAE